MRLFLICWLAISFTVRAQEPVAMLPDAPQPAVVAQARDVRWDMVEGLAPGESVELREQATGVRTSCLVGYVNDEALACDVYDRRGPVRRVVYPHGGVDRVWVTRWAHGPSGKAFLIGAGIGAALGGAAVARNSGSAKAVTAGIIVGSGLGSLVVLSSDPLGLRSHEQRVLIYRAKRA